MCIYEFSKEMIWCSIFYWKALQISQVYCHSLVLLNKVFVFSSALTPNRIGSDLRCLYAIGALDDYELLKKEVVESVSLLSKMEERIKDRLHAASRQVSHLLYPPHNEVVGGVYWFHSVRPSVRPSVCPSVRPSVRPSRMPCPLCIIYSYWWILFIIGTNDHYHERVCRAPWPLTLTYIFKVIWPWLRKSCPLCSVYSSGWILPIFGTNDNYH